MTKSNESERAESGEDVKCVAILCFQFGVYVPCPADHVQDWQPYTVDAQFAENDDHTLTPSPLLEPYPLHFTYYTIDRW